jgi:hypothetical protein
MAHPQHVESSKVKKRNSRRFEEESSLVRTINCIAEFKHKTETSPQKSYIFNLLHDIEAGRPCMVLISLNNDVASYFKDLLFVKGVVPSDLVLVGTSK